MRSAQLPDVIAFNVLAGWVDEVEALGNTLEDLLDALEWPDNATYKDIASGYPEFREHERPSRADISIAIRSIVHKVHALTSNLHIGKGLREVAAMLSYALKQLNAMSDASQVLDREEIRREIDSVTEVLNQRIMLVIQWQQRHRSHAMKIQHENPTMPNYLRY